MTTAIMNLNLDANVVVLVVVLHIYPPMSIQAYSVSLVCLNQGSPKCGPRNKFLRLATGLQIYFKFLSMLVIFLPKDCVCQCCRWFFKQ